MSDEKKPFADVGDNNRHPADPDFEEWLVLDGHRVSLAHNLAGFLGDINAAVERREARLRAVLKRVEWRGAGVDEPYTCCPVCLVENEFHPSNQKPHRPDCALAQALAGAGPDYVNGDVACGLALDLGIAMGTVADLALMLEASSAGPLLVPFLRAKRLAEQTPEQWSDEELKRRHHESRDELLRREKLRAPSVVQRFNEIVINHRAAVERVCRHHAMDGLDTVEHQSPAGAPELRTTVRVRLVNVASVWTRRVGNNFETQTAFHESHSRERYPWSPHIVPAL